MTYEYWCEECKQVTAIEKSMMDDIPSFVKCNTCELSIQRMWSNMVVHIPENFKATSEIYNSDTGNNMDYLKERMNHGKRPSGKDKVYY